MSAGIPYLGSKISLVSNSGIRYEGILYTIDTTANTVALAKVRSFGTEDRPTDRPVGPREEVYEYIIFRGSDIKDIGVLEPPKPQPTLQGGLPNDPAIVKHSSSPQAIPTVGATTGFGILGKNNSPEKTRFSGSQTTVELRRDSNEGNNRSVQDSQTNGRPQSAARGGGSSVGFHRGGRAGYRGRGGGGIQTRGGNHNFSAMREGGQGVFYQPGRPQSEKNETLKFDDDYDFQQANEQFKEVLNKINTINVDDPNVEITSLENDKHGKESADAVAATETEEGDNDRNETEETFYDKQTSFFDSISCEALERSKGKLVRNNWREERRINKETFGEAANRSFGHAGRGGFVNNRGSRGFNNQSGQSYARGRGFGRGGQGMGQNGFRTGYDNGGDFRVGFGCGGYWGQRGGEFEGQRGYGSRRGFGRNIGREFGRGGLGGDRMGQRGSARGGLTQGYKRPV